MELARVVLGALLLGDDPSAVQPDDFVFPAHRAIFTAILALKERGFTPSAALISDQMHEHPHEFWREEWAICLNHACASKNLPAHLAALREQRRKGDLYQASMRMTDLLESGAEPQQVLTAMGEMSELAHPRSREPVSFASALAEVFTLGRSRPVPLGISALDRLHVVAGELCAVGARPGVGKSAMLSTIAIASLRAGWQVLFVSLEMSAAEVSSRLLAAYADRPLGTIRDDPAVLPHATALSDLPLSLRAPGQQIPVPRFVQDVRQVIVDFTAHNADRDTVVLVDYLQLVRTRTKSEKRYEALGDVCRTLKETAGTARVPIIVGAQVGRSAEQRGQNARPQMSDLRESGDIEQDCDSVLLLHRNDNSTDLKVAKQRNGPTFTAECEFVPDRCLFRDRDDYGAF